MSHLPYKTVTILDGIHGLPGDENSDDDGGGAPTGDDALPDADQENRAGSVDAGSEASKNTLRALRKIVDAPLVPPPDAARAVKIRKCFVGAGHSRSLFASVGLVLSKQTQDDAGNVTEPWTLYQRVSAKGHLFVPRFLLYLAFLLKVIGACNACITATNVWRYAAALFFIKDAPKATFCYFVFRRALERILGKSFELDADRLEQSMLGLPSFGFMGAGGVPTIDELTGKRPGDVRKCTGSYSGAAMEQYWRFRNLYGQRLQRKAMDKLGYRGLFLTWGVFEDLCCEYRKYCTRGAVGRKAHRKAPDYDLLLGHYILPVEQ